MSCQWSLCISIFCWGMYNLEPYIICILYIQEIKPILDQFQFLGVATTQWRFWRRFFFIFSFNGNCFHKTKNISGAFQMPDYLKHHHQLGGGFNICFTNITPNLGANDPIWLDFIFFKWIGSTTHLDLVNSIYLDLHPSPKKSTPWLIFPAIPSVTTPWVGHVYVAFWVFRVIFSTSQKKLKRNC